MKRPSALTGAMFKLCTPAISSGLLLASANSIESSRGETIHPAAPLFHLPIEYVTGVVDCLDVGASAKAFDDPQIIE
jgi:hypothetical protein